MVGNKPNFSKVDVMRCFLYLGTFIGTCKGRSTLARDLELGEGTISTILAALKAKSLLKSSQQGHALSKKGKLILNKINQHISDYKKVHFDKIYPGFKKFGVVLKYNKNLKNTYRLRDLAVKNGAEGALILMFNKKLYAPELDTGYKVHYNELEDMFKFEKGNILILTFAESYRDTENGAFSIANELIKDKGINYIAK